MKIKILNDLFFGFKKETKINCSKMHISNKRISWIISFFTYKNPEIKNMIWQLKYRANFSVAKEFAKIMSDFLVEDLYYESLHTQIKYVAIIYVPIHWRRFLERGFNQSYILSKYILNNYHNFNNTKIKFLIYKNILKRIKYTKKTILG